MKLLEKTDEEILKIAEKRAEIAELENKHATEAAMTMEEQAKQQLLYPFRGLHTVESQWVFALGLKGLVYNISLYSGEMTNDQIRMLYCLGRFTPNLSRGVGVPQTSCFLMTTYTL